MDTQAHTLQPESLGHSLDPVTAEAVARLQQFRRNLYVLFPHRNLVTIVRLPSNRMVYRQFQRPPEEKAPAGHPTWYGARFDLRDATTHPEPDAVAETTFTTKQGKIYTVLLAAWHDMVRTGTRDIPMHAHPFTLVRARVVDASGQSIYRRDLGLIVIGERRRELALIEVWKSYSQRYDLEHFFRHGKQRLLMATYQTPEVAREENWWQIVQLAYVQLWLARSLVTARLNPERYLPPAPVGEAAPSSVQRDFARIIGQIGTPAQPPKRRGNSPGRTQGTKMPPRERRTVIKKTQKNKRSPQIAQKTA